MSERSFILDKNIFSKLRIKMDVFKLICIIVFGDKDNIVYDEFERVFK